MIVNEIFYSLQGEGLLTGVPSVFIRLAGCELGCEWCDTKYAWDPAAGVDLSIPEILARIAVFSSDPCLQHTGSNEGRATSHECRFIVITGGEPMTHPQLARLAAALKEQAKHVTVETAGIKFVPDLACDLMSISPKTSNSGTKTTPDPFFAIKQLIKQYPYQLKFVVESGEDLPEIRQAVEAMGELDPARIMLMPQAKTRRELLTKTPMVAELCKNTGYTFCNRLQVLLYDGLRGK